MKRPLKNGVRCDLHLPGADLMEAPVLPGGFCETVMRGLGIKIIPMAVIIQITVITLMTRRRRQCPISKMEILSIVFDVDILI